MIGCYVGFVEECIYRVSHRFVLQPLLQQLLFPQSSSAAWTKTYSVTLSTLFTDDCDDDENSEPLFKCTASFTVVTDEEYSGYWYGGGALFGVGKQAVTAVTLK